MNAHTNNRISSCLIAVLKLAVVVFALVMTGHGDCGATTVSLQWDAVAGASGYKVYYQADSSTLPFAGTGAVQGVSPVNAGNQPSITISGLDSTHSYYFAVTAYTSTGSESSYSNIVYVPSLASNVSVTLSGGGNGNVNSSPSGIACTSGTCGALFSNGSSVVLLASPSNSSTSLSYFDSWSGCANTSGNSCTLAVSSSAAVTASFVTLQPVKINGGSYFSGLQAAYTGAATGKTILSQAVTISGDLTANSTKTIKFAGGYNADYSSKADFTILKGTLTVASGSVVTDNIAIY